MHDERHAELECGETAGDRDPCKCYAVFEPGERVAGFSQPPPPAALRGEQYDALRRLMNESEEADGRRFSLSGLFLLVTAMSVLLAVGSRLPRPLFAGIAGLATLAGMVVLSLARNTSFLVHVGWWTLLFIYLLAIGWTVWG